MLSAHLFLALTLCGLFTGKLFAQDKPEKEARNTYGDSAVYYLETCLSSKVIDSTELIHALDFMYRMPISREQVSRIEAIGEGFKQRGSQIPYEWVLMGLVDVVTNSDSLDLAYEFCNRIILEYEAGRLEQERSVALEALVNIRKPLRRKDFELTFNYYTDRLGVSLGQNDSTAISICYFGLGTTYRLTGLTDMAIYNFQKARAFVNRYDKSPGHSMGGLGGWINHTSVLGQLFLEAGDYDSAISYSKEAKEARLSNTADQNVSFLNGNIAHASLRLNRLDGVLELLSESILMADRSNDYPSLVRLYEIKGEYYMMQNQLDSAEAALLTCKETMREHRVNYFSAAGLHTPNYHLARINVIREDYRSARRLLEEEIVEIDKIRAEVLKELKLLIEVYHKLGDSQAADSTFMKFLELDKLMRDEERRNRKMSFEVESRIEEAEGTIKNLVTEKKIASITRAYLIGVALLLLIVAAVIFNRFLVTRNQKKIIEKEKRRSEELLLNILPEEVAEELKATGEAEAAHIDQVTVMFTDFKGFTAMSEVVTPRQLVHDLHECFSAFDRIAEKYGVEKIKTIGDAYMAAGGLPTPNQTNAHDVVRAALEIRDFIAQGKADKIAKGLPYFEVRIGVHTGPVVAGIVGVRKFSYDIWGDTVNLASRMESSGEAGKVNISASTYALIRDQFRCEYRGKVAAKNKGEIDMYFVEDAIQQ